MKTIRVNTYYSMHKDYSVYCNSCDSEMEYSDAAFIDDDVYCYECVYMASVPSGICPGCRNYTTNSITLCGDCRKNEMYRKALNQLGSEIARTDDQRNKNKLTPVEWFDVLRHFNFRCAYCERGYRDLDHYVPVSKGGKTIAGNCLPACQSCNSAKRAKHPRKFTEPARIEKIEQYLKFTKAKHSVAVGIERMANRVIDIRNWVWNFHAREVGLTIDLDE